MSVEVTYGPLLDDGDTQFSVFSTVKTIAKPDSVKRVKPLDLFAASTDRTTFDSLVVNSLYQPYVVPAGAKYSGLSPLTTGVWITLDNSHADATVKGKMLDAIKRQNVNLAMAMIEFRQTAELFLTLSRELLQGWRRLRKLHFGQLYRDLKKSREFSKKWIEFQFGLLPLISDIEGTLESLHDKIVDGEYIYLTETYTERTMKEQTRSDPNGSGKLFDTVYSIYTVKIHARYMIHNEKLDDFRRFGFTNPLALAWEAVPFSFVVDWAIPIGDYLNRLDALVGTKNLSYILSGQENLAWQTDGRGGTATMNSRRRFRTMNQTGLSIPKPQYEPSQSLRKIVTGLSLIRLLGR